MKVILEMMNGSYLEVLQLITHDNFPNKCFKLRSDDEKS